MLVVFYATYMRCVVCWIGIDDVCLHTLSLSCITMIGVGARSTYFNSFFTVFASVKLHDWYSSATYITTATSSSV